MIPQSDQHDDYSATRQPPAEFEASHGCELPDLADVVEVVVDKDVVDGRKAPVRVYADKKAEAGDAA